MAAYKNGLKSFAAEEIKRVSSKRRCGQVVSLIAKRADDPPPPGRRKHSAQEADRIRQGEHRIISVYVSLASAPVSLAHLDR